MKRLVNINEYIHLYYELVWSNSKIANHFGCKISTLGATRARYGLPNREQFYPNLKADTSRKSTNLFKKGFTPWNKDKPFPAMAGKNNPNWKGGKFIDTHGYRIIKAPEGHPFAYKGYIKEHRLIAEQYIGRYLKPGEHIHHINGDKLNNQIGNLRIVSQSEHAKIHQPKGSRFGIHQR